MILRIVVWAGSQGEATLMRADCPATMLARVYGRDRRLRSVWVTRPHAPLDVKRKDGKTLIYQRGH